MSHRLLLGSIEACALENNVNIQSSPRAVVSVLLLVNLDFLAVNGNCSLLVISGNRMIPLAMSRIVLEQISQHRRRRQIVDRNNLIALGDKHLPECETTNTTESVNRNSYICHEIYDLLYVAR